MASTEFLFRKTVVNLVCEETAGIEFITGECPRSPEVIYFSFPPT